MLIHSSTYCLFQWYWLEDVVEAIPPWHGWALLQLRPPREWIKSAMTKLCHNNMCNFKLLPVENSVIQTLYYKWNLLVRYLISFKSACSPCLPSILYHTQAALPAGECRVSKHGFWIQLCESEIRSAWTLTFVFGYFETPASLTYQKALKSFLTMLSTRAVSQAVWKYVSATSVLAAGPSRAPTTFTNPAPKLVLPSGGRTESRSPSRWSAVSSSARIFRKFYEAYKRMYTVSWDGAISTPPSLSPSPSRWDVICPMLKGVWYQSVGQFMYM